MNYFSGLPYLETNRKISIFKKNKSFTDDSNSRYMTILSIQNLILKFVSELKLIQKRISINKE